MEVTWWGHATVAIRDRGVTVLTDPVLRNRLAHLYRRRGPRPALAHRPDAVVVSHLHSDHCDLPSLRMLPRSTRLIAPRGAAPFLPSPIGERDPPELRAGEGTRAPARTVRAVP